MVDSRDTVVIFMRGVHLAQKYIGSTSHPTGVTGVPGLVRPMHSFTPEGHLVLPEAQLEPGVLLCGKTWRVSRPHSDEAKRENRILEFNAKKTEAPKGTCGSCFYLFGDIVLFCHVRYPEVTLEWYPHTSSTYTI